MSRRPGRNTEWEKEARASHARVAGRLLALGFAETEADNLAAELLAVPPLAAPASRALHVLVGDFGAGKSLTAERLHLRAIDAARRSPAAPYPMLFDSGDLQTADLDELIRRRLPASATRRRKVHVVIDGLDELDARAASAVLMQARVLSRQDPGSRIWLTSRPSELLHALPERIDLPLLSRDDAAELAAHVANVTSSGLFAGTAQDFRETARRPLFALLYGLHLRRRLESGHITPLSEAEMLRDVVHSSLDDRRDLRRALEDAAVLSVDRGGGPVPLTDLPSDVAAEIRAESRVTFVKAGCYAFAVPILTHWFAAQALLAKRVDMEKSLGNSEMLERWDDALAFAIADASASRLDELMTAIAQQDPGLAGRLIDRSVRRWGLSEEVNAPPWQEAGRRVRNAMAALAAGAPEVAQQVGLVRPDGAPITLRARSEGAWLRTTWLDGDDEDDVIHFDGSGGRAARPGAGAGWPWRWALEDLRGRLGRRLDDRTLPIPASLAHETVWEVVRRLMGHPSFYEGSVDLTVATKVFEGIEETVVEVDGILIDLPSVLAWVRQKVEAGAAELDAPYPSRDQRIGRWVWTGYSAERLVVRARMVYGAAITGYEELVSSHFAKFRHRTTIAAVQPAVLNGRIVPERGDDYGPSISLWWAPVDRPPSTRLDFRLVEHHEKTDEIDEVIFELQRRRPRAMSWGYSQGILRVAPDRPALDITYRWLLEDLRRLGWTR